MKINDYLSRPTDKLVLLDDLALLYIAWKVSKYGVFSGVFPTEDMGWESPTLAKNLLIPPTSLH